MVPCRNPMGSILWQRDKDNEIQKSGWKPNLYAQDDHLRFFPWTIKSDPKLQKNVLVPDHNLPTQLLNHSKWFSI
jgi:hypothetical protein